MGKKFNLKDYEKWCADHKKDLSSEESLKEYKLSLEKENSLKKAKKGLKRENLKTFVKSVMVLCAGDDHLTEMQELANKVNQCIDDDLAEAIQESLLYAYGKTLVEICDNILTSVEIANEIREGDKNND